MKFQLPTDPDPIDLFHFLWPGDELYREEREIMRSVWDNYETDVPAGNELGKDFVAGRICPMFFLTRTPCRIVTTSAKDDHLRVLWGEINRAIQTSRHPLDFKNGGPLVVNHQDIRRVEWVNGKPQRCPISYIVGLVASQDSMAAMQGHHATPGNLEAANDGVVRTLFVPDECSSVNDEYYTMARTWAKRILAIGNCWDCSNFWRRNVKAGDLRNPAGPGYHRRVINIRAQDSPNVRHAIEQMRRGFRRPDPMQVRVADRPWGAFDEFELSRAEELWAANGRPDPPLEVVIPGVKRYDDYMRDRLTLDKVKQTVILDARFYEGAESLLFPPAWLDDAERLADRLAAQRVRRVAKAIGIDPAEGGDKTSMAAVDEWGLIEVRSTLTPDTSQIIGQALAFMKQHKVPADKVCFDRGGGGKQIADQMRSLGHKVKTVAFGSPVAPEMKRVSVARGANQFRERLDKAEDKSAYFNTRSEMYGTLSQLLDPANVGAQVENFGCNGFAIPRECVNLRSELAPIPKRYDGEGKLKLPSKHPSRSKRGEIDEEEETLIKLIGHSPDEADALVLAVHAMLGKAAAKKVGAAW